MSRSSYDQQLQRMWGQDVEGYNAPPWPATSAPQFRTKADARLQKAWCDNCANPSQRSQPSAVFPRENYEPLFGFRTEADKKLQAYWCPSCSHHAPQPKPHHNLGGFSFMCSPGLGCHKDSRAPGQGSDGVRYSNMEACESACQQRPHPQPPPGPHHNLGGFSFVCSPGLGCHRDSRPPGHGSDGVLRYSNMTTCESACPKRPRPPVPVGPYT